MSGIIEQVAKALCEAEGCLWPTSPLNQEHWLKRARAGLTAFRDSLTPAFADRIANGDRGYTSWPEDPTDEVEWFGDYEHFKKCWNAAFETILPK